MDKCSSRARMCSERLRAGLYGDVVKMMVKGMDTRSAYEIMDSDTGYGSKSRKAVRITARGNGKSWMTAVKSLTEAVGKKKASKIIAEVEKKMESDVKKDDEMDIRRDNADIEDGRYNDIRTYE